MKDDLDGVEVSQRLCVVGKGADNMVHRHVTVTSVTMLFINSQYRLSGNVHKSRHRKDNGRSTPYSDYGGTHAYLTCQRPDDGLRPLTRQESERQ